jgi:hypothetical protein
MAVECAVTLYMDPATLRDQQLVLTATAPGDYTVTTLDRSAGRIMLKRLSGGREVWFWTVTGPYIPSHPQPSHGEAETLADAKTAFRAKFDAW